MKKTQSKKLLREKQENGFRVELQGSAMPEYKAELDPYCPRAQVRKYNQDKRLNAEANANKTTKARDWIEKKLSNSFEEVPLKFNPTLRMKAQASAGKGAGGSSSYAGKGSADNQTEIEILQKVIVRENLLSELKRLLQNQTDVMACLGEVVELVKAIRYQTVEVVEDVSTWQLAQATRRAFLYRGANYLVKIFEDLSFLDQYEDITARFCFEFTGNPMAFRGGGDIVTGPGGSVKNESVERLAAFYNQDQGSFDGIEVVRLRNAEKIIQMEFDRLDQEKTIFAKQNAYAEEMRRRLNQEAEDRDGNFSVRSRGGSLESGGDGIAVGELGMGSVEGGDSSVYMDGQELALASRNIQTREVMNSRGGLSKKPQKVPATADRKWKQKFNARKVKAERAEVLTGEADELKAMESHLDDKINTLVEKHKELSSKRQLAETRRREAQSQSREAAAQHLTVEISLHTADMQDINASIKDLQRQIYFIAIERNRKRKVVKNLRDEIEADKKRAGLEQQLSEKIKEGGLINALKALNKIQAKEIKAAVGFNGTGSPPKRAKNPSEADSIVNFLEDFQAKHNGSQAGSQAMYDESVRGDGMTPFAMESFLEQGAAASFGSDDYDDNKGGAAGMQGLANAALAGARAGRGAGVDGDEEKEEGVSYDENEAEEFPAGSGISLARAKRAQGQGQDADDSLHGILSEAKNCYVYARYGEARDLIGDILSPVELERKNHPDVAIIVQARFLLAEINRAVANYVEAESLYLRCINDLEDAAFAKVTGMQNRNMLLLSVMAATADLYRNQCLYEEARDMLYKASKLSASLQIDKRSPSADNQQLAQAEYLCSQGAYSVAMGDYPAAEAHYKEALDNRRSVLGLDHYKVASSLAHLGRLAMLKDEFQKATRLIGESLAMRESTFEDPHPAVGASLYLKAQLLQHLGYFKESGAMLGKSLQMRRVCLSPKHPAVAESVFGQGELTRALGYPKQAQESYDEALRLRLKVSPEGGRSENHICVIKALVGLGRNAQEKGMYQEAHSLYEVAAGKAAALFPQRLVSNHPFEQEIHLRRADLFCTMNQHEKAQGLVGKAGEVALEKVGKNHSAVADGLLVFARVCTATGRYAQANVCLNRAVAMYLVLYGEEHPAVAETSLLQARNCLATGCYGSAAAAEMDSAALRKLQFSPNCGVTAHSVSVRARIVKDMRDYEQAKSLLEYCMETYLMSYGENSAFYAETLAEYGDYLRLSCQFKEAEQTLDRACVYLAEAFKPLIRASAHKVTHVSIARGLQYRAQLYMDTGRHALAVDCLEKDLFPAVTRLLGKEHPYGHFIRGLVAQCAKNLVGVSDTRPAGALSMITAETAQGVLDEVLQLLDTFDEQRSPFAEEHSWVAALGGYVDNAGRSSRNLRLQQARDSARNAARQGLTVNEGTQAAGTEADGSSEADAPAAAAGRQPDESNRMIFRNNLKFDGEAAANTEDLQLGLELALERRDMGLYAEAKFLLEDVLKARRRLELVNNSTIIHTRLALGDLHRGMADFAASDSLYQKCFSAIDGASEADMPEKPLLNLICLVGLADLARNQCKYAKVMEALDAAREGLAVLEAGEDARLETDVFRLAIADFNSCEAAFFVHKGEYDNAQDSYLLALSTRRAVLGVSHYKVASSLAHLGRLAMLKDEFQKATRLIGESLAMRESAFQESHPAVGASLYLKAQLLQRLGHFTESGHFLHRALQSRLKWAAGLDIKHPSVAESVYGLADLVREVGSPMQAVEKFDDALAMQQSIFLPATVGTTLVWHRKVSETMAGLARNAEDSGLFKKAAELWEQVLIQRHLLLKACGNSKYFYVAEVQLRLARVYCVLNKLSEAQGLVDKAGTAIFGLIGENHRPTKSQPMARHGVLSALVFYTLGFICNFRGQYCDAADCYDKTRRIFFHLFGYMTKSSYSYSSLEEDSSIRAEPVGEDAFDQDLDWTDPAQTGTDLREFFRSLDDFQLDKKITDLALPEYVRVMEATCVNIGVHGPSYLTEAWDLSQRAHALRIKMYCNDYYDKSTNLFWYDPQLQKQQTDKGGNSQDVLPMAHSIFLKGSLLVARAASNGTASDELSAASCFDSALNLFLEHLGDEGNCFYAAVYGAKGTSLMKQAVIEKKKVPKSTLINQPQVLMDIFRTADEMLSKALVLRRHNFGDQHIAVAESMQQIAFLLGQRGQLDEALALMKDGAVPMCEASVGHEHPFTLFMGGCVGLCMCNSGETNKHDADMAAYEVMTGNEMRRAVLEFMKSYKQGVFTPTHPWVQALGGYQHLIKMATKEPGKGASNDHEAEEIQVEVDNIPTKSSVGLIFNPTATAVHASLDLWRDALQEGVNAYAAMLAVQRAENEDEDEVVEASSVVSGNSKATATSRVTFNDDM